MQQNIRAVTGKQPVITDDVNKGNAVCISLGNTVLYQESAVKNSSNLNGDGFYIQKVGRNIFINAENDYGVINGVNYFSENYFGVKNLTLDCTTYENVGAVCLSQIKEETIIPDFSLRDYFAKQSMTNAEYAAKMGLESLHTQNRVYNGEGIVCGEIHGLAKLLPYSEYPQFYASSSDGAQRELDLTNGLTSSFEFDSSNKDSMIATLIAKIKTAIINDSTGKYVLLGLQDTDFIPDKNNDWKVKLYLGGYEGLYLRFCNIVAEEVYAWMASEGIERDIRFVAISYWKTWEYANCKENANEYVDIMLCDMFCQYHTILESCNSGHLQRFQGWKNKLSNNSELWIYNYATNFTHSLFWYDNFQALETNIRYYKEQGVNRIVYQAHPHAYNYYQGNLENYIISRLLWDSTQNVDDLVFEYNLVYYDDSASVVNTIYKNLLAMPSDSFNLPLYNGEANYVSAYPLAKLNENLTLLENEILRVKGLSSLTAEQKQTRVLRLLELEVQLRYMVLINWESYSATGDKNAYAGDLIYSLDLLGIEYVGEGKSVQALKNEYCMNLSEYLRLTYDGVEYDKNSPMQLSMENQFIDLTKLSISCSIPDVEINYRWSLYHGNTCLMSTDETLSRSYFDLTSTRFYAAVNNYGGVYTIKVEVILTEGYIGTITLYYNVNMD